MADHKKLAAVLAIEGWWPPGDYDDWSRQSKTKVAREAMRYFTRINSFEKNTELIAAT